MKLYELFSKLYNTSAMNPETEVLMDVGKEQAVDFTVELVFENGKVTGLVLVEDKQLKLPFDKEN